MGTGTKTYGSYMSPGRTNLRSRKITESRLAQRQIVICPFTLEAIKDCATRQKAPLSRCRFSLEGCQARRFDRRRFKSA
jgi:hypothetical protein